MNDKKTDSIFIRISNENKKKLINKAKEMNLNLSEYLERVAENQVLFISDRIKIILENQRFV